MKKFLAILLALVMVLAMVACGGDKAPAADDTAGSTDAGSTEGESGGSGLVDTTTSGFGGQDEGEDISNEYTGEIGMYDPNYDYNANPRWKVCYYVLATSVLYEAFGDAFEHWCSVMNLEYGGLIDYAGDKDAYLSNLQTIATEYDGVLLDPDAEQYKRCAEILNEAGTAWMGCMSDARDYAAEGKPLLHPYIGFNQYDVGKICAEYLIGYYQKTFPDVPADQIAWSCIDYSTSPTLHMRETGFYETITAHDPTIADRYWVADTAIATFDLDTSNTVMSAVLAEHPEYEYWMVFGETDTQSQGAAVAFDTAGLTETCATVTFGGTGLQLQWDAGIQDSWVAACYLPQTIYAEPIIGALYAFMSGQATPETIFEDWIPLDEPAPYARRSLPAFWIEYENYKHVIKWSDIYAGSNFYADYPAEFNGQPITRDDFSTTVKIPAEGYRGSQG